MRERERPVRKCNYLRKIDALGLASTGGYPTELAAEKARNDGPPKDDSAPGAQAKKGPAREIDWQRACPVPYEVASRSVDQHTETHSSGQDNKVAYEISPCVQTKPCRSSGQCMHLCQRTHTYLHLDKGALLLGTSSFIHLQANCTACADE